MSVALARRFQLQVSADNTSWVNFGGMTDFAPSESPTYESTADYDTDGFDANEKTLTTWGLVCKANRKQSSGVFDPGQELVRARQFQFGDAARVYVRWFDRNGAPEAKTGRALVEWNQTKTGVSDVEEVTFTAKGDGILTDISSANPASTAAVPVILSATPGSVTTAGQVEISGGGFTSTVVTTGVKFGATNATSWLVVSDSLIVAIMPSGSPGSAAITVTNAAGASAAFPYTRT